LPIGTAFHERTFPLCQSLNYREWSGYYTVSVYEVHHEHEYNAIRNATALIDISPLYKYLITGKDATRLVNRVITRDINKVKVGQVIYCCWCDEEGKVIERFRGWRRMFIAGPRLTPACAGSGRTA
jgi:aminomethyltransferase